MTRSRWIVLLMLALAATAAARHRPLKPKPKNAAYLRGTRLWYMLHVPQDYNPRQSYPLLVVAPYRDDYAAPSFQVWEELAKEDRLFLAALNFPPGYKEDREPRFVELVVELLRTYHGIDHRRMVFVGLEAGAVQVLKFAASYPYVFATGLALNPRGVPKLEEIERHRSPKMATKPTRIYITVDPENESIQEALKVARRRLKSSGVLAAVKEAVPVGLGKPSDDEAKLARQVIRSQYSDSKRARVLARLRGTAEEERKKREAEKKKLAAAEKKKERPPEKGAPPKKAPPPEEADPDKVMVAAQEAYDQREYARAIELYEKLAELRPDSDYAALAKRRIDELLSDPTIKRVIADERAGRKAKSMLSLAENFQKAGETERAAVYYKKIVEDFPGTSFAKKAQDALDDLDPN
jgi:tetratricopeptide (TPR) repeat protein